MKLPEELFDESKPKTIEDERRIQIFEATIKVFGLKGINNTKISDIAEKAGLGKGTIYQYFKSKDELMTYTFYKMLMLSFKFIPEHINYKKSARENLEDYLEGAIKFFRIMPNEIAMAYMGLFLESFFQDKQGIVEYLHKIGLPIETFQMRYTNFIVTCYRMGIENNEWSDISESDFMGLIITYIQGIKMLIFFADAQFPEISPKLFLKTMINGIGSKSDNSNNNHKEKK